MCVQEHPNNGNSEMVFVEYLEYLMRLARIKNTSRYKYPYSHYHCMILQIPTFTDDDPSHTNIHRRFTPCTCIRVHIQMSIVANVYLLNQAN